MSIFSFNLNLNHTAYATLDVNISKVKICALIDSGAQTSLIKINRLKSRTYIDTTQKCKFSGITKGYITSVGVVSAKIFLNDHNINFNLHVVEEDFPLPADAILGNDFLNQYKCIIDFNEKKLQINLSNHAHEVIEFIQNPEQFFTYVIPARSQVIRYLPQKIAEPTVVHKQQIADGVFIANTLITPQSQFISILNINMTPQSINLANVDLKTSSLNDYDIVSKATKSLDRINKIKSIVEKNIPEYARKSMLPLIEEYSDVFALSDEKLSTNNFYKAKIRVKDDDPVYRKGYRLPETHKPIIRQKIDEMLKDDIIEETFSPYNSPILLVPKKSMNGKPEFRLVVDYRELNKKVIPDKFPLPRIDDILDQLGRAKHFSVIDLKSGFHQIELEEKSRDFTSFSDGTKAYRFKRVPFGLSISPGIFCRMMAMAFSGLPPETCFLYVDDLCIAACSVKQHIKKLKLVFEACRKHNLKLNTSKCKFFQSTVIFLGHQCTADGVLPDPSKYDTVKNYPVPKSADEARRFVAFSNYYRRFIKNFAGIAQPLNRLTRKRIKFEWTKECQKSFESLKNCLTKPPVLKYPDFQKTFTITTDASNVACGAILSQEYDGIDLPISYYSRSFSKGEKNKTTIEKELLAIYFAIDHFRPYVYGRHFVVKSDHRPLVHLFSLKKASSRLTRIRLELEEYDFEVIYIPGRDNVTADALSRIDISVLKELGDTRQNEVSACVAVTTRAQAKKQKRGESKTLDTQQINNPSSTQTAPRPKVYETLNNNVITGMPIMKFNIKKDFSCTVRHKRRQLFEIDLERFLQGSKLNLQAVFNVIDSQMKCRQINELAVFKNDEIFDHFKYDTIVKIANTTFTHTFLVIAQPIVKVEEPEERKKIIKLFHNDPILGGHCGTQRLLAKIRSYYFWRGMARDAYRYVHSCTSCQFNKAGVKNKPFSTITPTPAAPFDIVFIDLVGPFTESDCRNKFAVTLMDSLSKYVVIAPIPNKEATTVAQALVDQFILIYGPMRNIHMDGGKEFINEIFTNVTKLLNISTHVSAPWHPQSIAPLERNHRVLNSYLRMYVNNQMTNWDVFAKYYALHWNTSPHPLLNNYSPFELVFNRKPNIPLTTSDNVEPVYNPDDFAKVTKYRFQSSHRQAKKLLEKLKEKQKLLLDAQAKEKSFKIGEKVLITKEDRNKMDAFYQGPYEIEQIEYPNVFLKIKNRNVKIHMDRLRKYNDNDHFATLLIYELVAYNTSSK